MIVRDWKSLKFFLKFLLFLVVYKNLRLLEEYMKSGVVGLFWDGLEVIYEVEFLV